jgi:16S rRNA (uracil1498-N3)-methyltransferase
MQLFYQPGIPDGLHYLDEEESRHCIKVLRLKTNDPINLIDGKGSFYKAIITQANPKKCEFEIQEKEAESSKLFYIHIAIAPTKNADRLEWFIEKCTEIGIDEITPLLCKHSERKKLNTERLEKKAIGAIKQSVKATLPIVNQPVEIKKFLASRSEDEQKFIAYVDQTIPAHLKNAATPKGKYCVLIGPEGDFAPQEIQQAFRSGFHAVSLGKSRLRTETAGLTSCLVLNLINE